MHQALAKIAQLMSKQPPLILVECDSSNLESDIVMDDSPDPIMDDDPIPPLEDNLQSLSSGQKSQRHRLLDPEAMKLYTAWINLLPTLVKPLLAYTTMCTSKGQPAIDDLQSSCTMQCTAKMTSVQCLYFDCM
jgi:hypothetical protein